MITFVKCSPESPPCIDQPAIRWHSIHGWVWNVIRTADGTPLGCLYCTLVCGEGCIVHFDSVPAVAVTWRETLTAMRKAMRMLTSYYGDEGAVFASIPLTKTKLLRVARCLGFRETGAGWRRADEGPVALLQFLPERENYIMPGERRSP